MSRRGCSDTPLPTALPAGSIYKGDTAVDALASFT